MPDNRFVLSLVSCTIGNSAGEGKLIDLALIGESPVTLTLAINPIQLLKPDVAKFKPDMTSYIGHVYDIAVKILPVNCIRLLLFFIGVYFYRCWEPMNYTLDFNN